MSEEKEHAVRKGKSIIVGDFTFEEPKSKWISYKEMWKAREAYEEYALALMEAHYAFYGQLEDETYVTVGSILSCSLGTENITVNLPIDHGVVAPNQKGILTCKDCKSGTNIGSFGTCMIDSADFGPLFPHPTQLSNNEDKEGCGKYMCYPLLFKEWIPKGDNHIVYIMNGEEGVFEEAIKDSAVLLCQYGGVITVKQVDEGDDDIEEEEENKKGDIQIAPWLFAYRGEPDLTEKDLVENFDNDEKLLTKKRNEYSNVEWYAYETYKADADDEYAFDKNGQKVTINEFALKQYDKKELTESELALQFTDDGGFVNEDGRYWIAVGPEILSPGYAKLSPDKQTVNESEFDFGTEIDVVLEKKNLKSREKKGIDDGVAIGEKVYIKCVVGDVKNHTYDKSGNSIFQTGIPHPGTTASPDLTCQKGVYIEFMYKPEKMDQAQENGTMSDYNVVEIIVYKRVW